MDIQKKSSKQMISTEKIYMIMEWLPIVVSAAFFIINVTKGNVTAMVVIGLCLVGFISTAVIVKVKNVSMYNRQFVMSLALPTLAFMISLFSGASYSDDFPLMLAIISLSGMFLEPKITRAQIVLAEIYLVLMYIIHPEKSGGLSQYILTAACFTLAAVLLYQVIKRGSAFIKESEDKAKESEALLVSIKNMGAELQKDFDESSKKIEVQTSGLKKESVSIAGSAGAVSDSCSEAKDKVLETKTQIHKLDDGVKQFEASLNENKENMETMNEKVDAVGAIINESGEVFRTLQEEMQEIVGVAKQISDIAFKLTILSLNASVESAHAGKYGVGFEIIAAEMRELSENSSNFSDRVSDIVKDLLVKVDNATKRVGDSEEAMAQSKNVMVELVDSFSKLNEQFANLYGNIEAQTYMVNEIDNIFSELEYKVSDMHNSALANQQSVEGIATAMVEFSGNVGEIVKNTQAV